MAYTFGASTNRIDNQGLLYDAAGNLLQDSGVSPGWTYQWDAEERLVSVDGSTASQCAAGAIACATYNALGQRVQEWTPSRTTNEAYDPAGQLLWRYTGGDFYTRAFVPFQGRGWWITF